MGRRRSETEGEIPEQVLEYVMDYIEEPRDRRSMSLVCKQWFAIEGRTRKHVTLLFCYAALPEQLTRRFTALQSLTIKGKPRASMYHLLPSDWGGSATHWINHIATAACSCLKSLHLRRMVVSDSDLQTLATARSQTLQSITLDICSGFSTLGLQLIATKCRWLKVLSLTESSIEERSGDWLHQLALHNTSLETLNLYMTELEMVDTRDLELLAANCPSLTCLIAGNSDFLDLRGILNTAAGFTEFGGGQCSGFLNSTSQESQQVYQRFKFPAGVVSLVGLSFMTATELAAILPQASRLKKLDLQYTFLTGDNLCQLIPLCTNLEVLEVRNVIGDTGLEIVGSTCKRLRRLRVERGADEPGSEDEQGWVSHKGLSSVAQGCPLLEYLAVYLSDICNSSLETIGRCCKNLKDFRLVLLDKEEHVTELPLDKGLKSLLMGCRQLRRFAFYVRPGGLTDTGLAYIGQYGVQIKWLLLGFAGQSDMGLIELCKGCPELERLEMRGCYFSESALAYAIPWLKSLRYLWVQGYNATPMGLDLLPMSRPFWNIEFCPGSLLSPNMLTAECIDAEVEIEKGQIPQVIAYYTIGGTRTDYPDSMIVYPPPHMHTHTYTYHFG